MMRYLNKISSPKELKKLGPKALQILCGELRHFLIHSIAETGGHLASNLGVVELTVALHFCFNSPKDKLIWDVGHQAYVHKILTGRKNRFGTLRQLDGLSGFPKSAESPHDTFDVGHSSTSISLGLGYALSRDLSGLRHHVVSVIGDGAMTSGLAFEALNNAGRTNTNLIVILNDNQMSISENVGAFPKYLNKIRTAPTYLGAKADVNKFLNNMPIAPDFGRKLSKGLEMTKDTLRYWLLPGVLFEEFGFRYVGPVNGNDLDELIYVLSKAKKMKGPILLHVLTTKGKGYENAEKFPSAYHGVDSFYVETGLPTETKIWDTYTDVMGKELCELAKKNEKIVAITAAMPLGTGLAELQKLKKRVFDVGIAEGHAVTFAAAMAKNGYIPVVAIYSTFLQRAYDQILHDVCIQNLHVVFAVDRAGIVGADGETHQGLFDISFLSHMPNMTIMAPKNKKELQQMLEFAINAGGPVAIRYPRDSASRVLPGFNAPIEQGRSEIILQGEKVALVSVGAMMDIALEVAKKLEQHGPSPTLINARFIKPIDTGMLEVLMNHSYVAVLEDSTIMGGFGSALLQKLSSIAGCRAMPKVRIFAFPDAFIPQGSRDEIFKRYNMNWESIYERVKNETAGHPLI